MAPSTRGERLERLDHPLWVSAAADDDEQGRMAWLERFMDRKPLAVSALMR